MRITRSVLTALVGLAVPLTFAIGALLPACIAHPSRASAPHATALAPSDLVIAYARKHPDPAVRGPFADKLATGEIRILLEKPREHAMASFGRREGSYALTIDPALVAAEPTSAQLEDVLAILSHEHAHYRQYAEGQMTNYHPGVGRMSETQCTLTILVEIDAHGKACRDAKAHGWSARAAKHSCDQTPASIASYFIRERLDRYAECKPVWEHFASHVPGAKLAAPKQRAAKPPRKRDLVPNDMPPPS